MLEQQGSNVGWERPLDGVPAAGALAPEAGVPTAGALELEAGVPVLAALEFDDGLPVPSTVDPEAGVPDSLWLMTPQRWHAHGSPPRPACSQLAQLAPASCEPVGRWKKTEKGRCGEESNEAIVPAGVRKRGGGEETNEWLGFLRNTHRFCSGTREAWPSDVSTADGPCSSAGPAGLEGPKGLSQPRLRFKLISMSLAGPK